MTSRSEIKRITALDPGKVIEEIEGLRAKLKLAEEALERITELTKLFPASKRRDIATDALAELRKA